MNIDLSNLNPAVEGIFISGKDVSHDLDKWKQGKIKILYIVGFSGSGKTTLAKELAEEYDAELNETDNWMVDADYNDQVAGLLKYVNDRRKDKRKTIIEGLMVIDLFSYGDNVFNFFEDCAAIAKGTSFVSSTIRATLRDASESNHGWWKHFKWRYNTNRAFLADYDRFVEFVNDGLEISSDNAKIKIGKSTIQGKGLICSSYIQADEMLCLAFKRIGNTGNADEDWELSENAHFINHSSNPNVKLIHNKDKTRYIFIAIKNIKKGEELVTNYNEAPDFVNKPDETWK